MAKTKLQDLITILNNDEVKYNSCIEMNFFIDNDAEYEDLYIFKESNNEK